MRRIETLTVAATLSTRTRRVMTYGGCQDGTGDLGTDTRAEESGASGVDGGPTNCRPVPSSLASAYKVIYSCAFRSWRWTARVF